MPVIPALRRLRQEALKFKVNLGYIVKPSKNSNKRILYHLVLERNHVSKLAYHIQEVLICSKLKESVIIC
jgi:hypothetical protein